MTAEAVTELLRLPGRILPDPAAAEVAARQLPFLPIEQSLSGSGLRPQFRSIDPHN
jgi:hypothetical protein